ncbi:MAG TPA: hypothetical protein VFU22_08210 [Roseiflexaceae bacterium]|nr:hypothetical protein [Roseiflexaceae bacterium]
MADGLSILAAVEQENRVQTLGDATIIGLLEAPPHIFTLGATQGKQLLAHVLFLCWAAQHYTPGYRMPVNMLH